jgi:hypothetical protein
VREWLRLLSNREFTEYNPEEFRLHIRTLYHERRKRKSPSVKIKKAKPPFVWGLTKSGNLTIKVNRAPKALSPSELDQISKESGRPANEIFLYVKKRKIAVV